MNSSDFKNVSKALCKKIVQLENAECSICFDPIKVGTLLLPCNHYQVCFKCFADIDTCPICRSKINYIVNYYSDDKYTNNTIFFDSMLENN
jgi:hypothetical protein